MKTVVISGATSGIGLAVTRALLVAGWFVIGIGSQLASCSAALEKLPADVKQNSLF